MAGEGVVTLAIVAKNLTAAELANVQGALKNLQLQTKELNVQLQPTTGTTSKLFQSLEHGQFSVRRLTSSMSFFAVEASGMNHHVASLAEGLLLFGGGHGVVLGAVVAVTGLALAIKLLSGGMTEHEQQVSELKESYKKLITEQSKVRDLVRDVAMLTDIAAEAEQHRKEAQQEVSDVQAGLIGDDVSYAVTLGLAATATKDLAEATALREVALTKLEKPGLDEVDRLTAEALGLERSKGAVERYRLAVQGVPPDIIANVKVMQDWIDQLHREQAARLFATEGLLEEAKARLTASGSRYGEAAAADAQAVALAELRSKQAGDDELTQRQKGHLEQLRLERERYILTLRAAAAAEQERTEGTGASGINTDTPGASATTFVSQAMLEGASGIDSASTRITEALSRIGLAAGDDLGRFKAAVGDNMGAWERLRDLVAQGVPVKEAVDKITFQMQLMQGVTETLQAGFTSMFTAIGEGSKFSASQFLRSMARMAAAKASFEVAEGIAALAMGLFPGHPGAIAAAINHFKAAALFGVLAGGLSVAAGSGGGGSSPGSSALGSTAPVQPTVKTGDVYIQGGLLDMTNPQQADAFGKAYKELVSRGITDITLHAAY